MQFPVADSGSWSFRFAFFLISIHAELRKLLSKFKKDPYFDLLTLVYDFNRPALYNKKNLKAVPKS